jgi:hypothetical protein
VTITLSERERQALVRVLEAGLGELRREAARTERPRHALPLWEDEHILGGLLDRLRAEAGASSGAKDREQGL